MLVAPIEAMRTERTHNERHAPLTQKKKVIPMKQKKQIQDLSEEEFGYLLFSGELP